MNTPKREWKSLWSKDFGSQKEWLFETNPDTTDYSVYVKSFDSKFDNEQRDLNEFDSVFEDVNEKLAEDN